MAISLESFRSLVRDSQVLDGNVRLNGSRTGLVKVDFGGKYRKIVNKNARASANDSFDENRKVRRALLTALSPNGSNIHLSDQIRNLVNADSGMPLSRRTIKQVLSLYDAQRQSEVQAVQNAREVQAAGTFQLTSRQFNTMLDKGFALLGIKDAASRKFAAAYVQTLKDAFAQCGGDVSRLNGADPLLVKEMKDLLSGALDDDKVCAFLSRRMPFGYIEQRCTILGATFNSQLARNAVAFMRQLDAEMLDLQNQVDAFVLACKTKTDPGGWSKRISIIGTALGQLKNSFIQLNRYLLSQNLGSLPSEQLRDKQGVALSDAFAKSYTGAALLSAELKTYTSEMLKRIDLTKASQDSTLSEESRAQYESLAPYWIMHKQEREFGLQLQADFKSLNNSVRDNITSISDAFRACLADLVRDLDSASQ